MNTCVVRDGSPWWLGRLDAGLQSMGVAAIMHLQLQWPGAPLNLSKVHGLIMESLGELVKVRKVLLALYWSGERLVTPLHQAPEYLIQTGQVRPARRSRQ